MWSYKKYVDWLIDTTRYHCLETKKAAILAIVQYDVIILAGGIYASGIAGLSFLKKNIDNLKGKQIAVFALAHLPLMRTLSNRYANITSRTHCRAFPAFMVVAHGMRAQ
ncbi:flavodoxin domain-containing protein [Blautia sp. RD014234]|nr:flavodoxin domain-containing protein [Blautia parvula]